MTRQERFEQIWSDFHAVPAESLVQYRWITQDGYRLPDMAAHYRTFCETLDSIAVEWPDHYDYTNSDIAGAAILDCRTAFQKAVSHPRVAS